MWIWWHKFQAKAGGGCDIIGYTFQGTGPIAGAVDGGLCETYPCSARTVVIAELHTVRRCSSKARTERPPLQHEMLDRHGIALKSSVVQ